jgi:hypothetical protein
MNIIKNDVESVIQKIEHMPDIQNSLETIQELYEKYKDNVYMLNKTHNYICSQLPVFLDNLKKNHEDRIQRMHALTNEQNNFIQSFLNNNQFFYISTTEKFFYYDGEHYHIFSEDDILHYVLSSITQGRQLMCWKQKTKKFIMKRIKENNLLKSVPESETIQFILDLLYPSVFSSKYEAKYFLTIIGDNILKKNTELIHFIDSKSKHFIRELNNTSLSLIGQNLSQTLKHKYHEHDYTNCRLLNINDTIKTEVIWKPIIDNILDVICVASHYSQRYNSSDEYIIKFNNDNVLNDTVFYLKNTNQEELIKTFISDYLQLNRFTQITNVAATGSSTVDILSNTYYSTTNPSNAVLKLHRTPHITWKNMQYLWKKYLDSIHLPNIMFQQTLKTNLIIYLKDVYHEEADCFIGISSKYLPAIQTFFLFWEETVSVFNELSSPTDMEYEIEEICFLFKQWCSQIKTEHVEEIPNINYKPNILNDKQILDLITYFFPDVEIEKDKYISKIKCSLWNKQQDIQFAINNLKQYLQSNYYIYPEMKETGNDTNLITADFNIECSEITNWNISIYDAYRYYCKYITSNYPLNQIVSKSYFEKYIFENFNEYIVESKFISMDWIYF